MYNVHSYTILHIGTSDKDLSIHKDETINKNVIILPLKISDSCHYHT